MRELLDIENIKFISSMRRCKLSKISSFTNRNVFHRFGHIDSFFMAPDILETMGVQGFITYYIFLMALVIGLLLLVLSYWHGKIIGCGQTSIERILYKIAKDHHYQQGKMKINEQNRLFHWKRFLGVRDTGDFILKVLLPSVHPPHGDGIRIDDLSFETNSVRNHRQIDHSSAYDLFPSNGYPEYSIEQQSTMIFSRKQSI